MTIESLLERNAVAQERIANALETIIKTQLLPAAVAAQPAPVQKSQPEAPASVEAPAPAAQQPVAAPAPEAPAPAAPTPSESPAPAPAPTPAAPAPEAPAPASQTAPAAPAPAPTVSMTADELNQGLIAEFQRLGSREPIDNVLKEYGVTGVTGLPQDKYAEVLAKVKAVPNA